MKKILLGILIGGIVFGTIGAGAAYVYTARDIGYTPNDESWNVTNANEALTSLKDDINQVSTDVNNYKSEIIEALNNNGSELSNDSSMEDIVTSINNSDGEIGDIAYIQTYSTDGDNCSCNIGKIINGSASTYRSPCSTNGKTYAGFGTIAIPGATYTFTFDGNWENIVTGEKYKSGDKIQWTYKQVVNYFFKSY